MDETKYLREDQWERIKDSFPGKPAMWAARAIIGALLRP